MKPIIILLCSLVLTACANMTPREKQTAWIVGGIVVTGIIISANNGSEKAEPSCKLQTCGSGADIFFCCR